MFRVLCRISAHRGSSAFSSSSVPLNAAAATTTTRIKHKVPQKRASKLLGILRQEEFANLKNNRSFPSIQPGDSIQIEKLPYITATTTNIIKGVVIAKTNRSSDTALRILNVEHGTPISRRIILYNPLIKGIKVLQKGFVHKGLKRVRRSKLYYLKDRHPDLFTVN